MEVLHSDCDSNQIMRELLYFITVVDRIKALDTVSQGGAAVESQGTERTLFFLNSSERSLGVAASNLSLRLGQWFMSKAVIDPLYNFALQS